MDGKNFRCDENLINTYFEQDRFGSFIPSPDKLQTDRVAERVKKQLNAKTGLYNRLATIYERTDVQFTDNPLGNSPTLGVGYKLFGKRPLDARKGERFARIARKNPKLDKQLQNRENKIEAIHNELYSVYSGLKPTLKTDQDKLLYAVEGDQIMTGGGFDNNAVGGVHKSALNFIVDSSAKIDYRDTVLSKLVVEGCLWVKDLLIKSGLKEGSLEPMGASVVRANQDNDGMFGWPVFASGFDPLDKDIAQRLLIESGVDTSKFVGLDVTDSTNKQGYKYRVIDAGGFILDNKVFSANDMVSLVVPLARIQKHGWKLENGKLIAKDGKTRSVYPNAFLPAVIESMIITPFNDKLKEVKVSIMPSLQDKPTRVEMIKRMIIDAINNKYDYLAADWSKYDASVKGSILATVMQLVVKPFFNARYYYWVDAATFILTYKYLMLDTNLAKISANEFNQAVDAVSSSSVKNYTIFGLVDGLISGAKFTHVGGSLYGMVVVHYCIPRLMGYQPIPGCQAGDDTLMGIPQKLIDISSAERTYTPISENAEKYGIHMNASKQIWHNVNGEVVKIFLQDSYHFNTSTWGIGSIFRPLDAIWVSEREKGLSIAEQLMAEIARANQGADSPFVKAGVEYWLTKERYLGWIFKEYGISAFNKIIESIGDNIDEIAKTIDVGSFTFGVDKEDLKSGNLPILSVMADVSANMSFSSEDKASFLSDLKPESKESEDDANPDIQDEDSIEDTSLAAEA